MGLERFDTPEPFALPDGALASYRRTGVMILEGFWSPERSAAVIQRAEYLARTADRPDHAAAFSTRSCAHAGDAYFRESGDKIRAFLEEGRDWPSGGEAPPVNKIGHAMHDLDPLFSEVSRDDRLATICSAIGVGDPGLIQSMVIFKRPRVGGEVGCHQDATFLYTDPVSVVGFWFALEDATLSNGCLQIIPGGHAHGLRQRFRYRGTELGMDVLGPSDWETPPEPVEVPAGTVVVLHGLLPHFSGPNTSDASRMAYTLHVIDRTSHWPADNWLRRGAEMPVTGF